MSVARSGPVSRALPDDRLPLVIDAGMTVIARAALGGDPASLAAVTTAVLPLMPEDWDRSYSVQVAKGLALILTGTYRWMQEHKDGRPG